MEIRAPEDLLRTKLRPLSEQYQLARDAKVAVVIDIETTGLSPNAYGEIIEIGAAKVDLTTRKTLATFDTFVKPTRVAKLSKKTTEITNITTDMVKDAPTIDKIIPQLYDFIGDSLVVCHNAPFDWFRFLIPAMQTGGRICTNEVVCTLAMARELHPHEKNHKLIDLCHYYGATPSGLHRASVDARFTASVLLRLIQEFPESLPVTIQPISAPWAPKKKFRLYSYSSYTAKTVSLGGFIYFKTSFGTLSYGLKLKTWSFQNLTVPYNVDMMALESWILDITKAKKLEDLFQGTKVKTKADLKLEEFITLTKKQVKTMHEKTSKSPLDSDQMIQEELEILLQDLETIRFGYDEAKEGELQVKEFLDTLQEFAQVWEASLDEDFLPFYQIAIKKNAPRLDVFTNWAIKWNDSPKNDHLTNACFAYLMFFFQAKSDFIQQLSGVEQKIA